MINLNKVSKTISHLQVKRMISKLERTEENNLKYVFLPKDSDTLLIVFSGFTGETRKYNYISSFKKLPVNQLYLLDSWGVKGSYYWLENGSDYPEETINSFLTAFLSAHSFNHVYTCGSSKGGTAAIYFGLLHQADRVFAGACQYRVGTYLNTDKHLPILKGMIGTNNKELMIDYLDDKLDGVINNYVGNSIINLFYSSKEPTYDNHILPLINELQGKVNHYEQEESFETHSEVGIYFPKYVYKEVIELSKKD